MDESRLIIVGQAMAAALELTKASVPTLNTIPQNLVEHFEQTLARLIPVFERAYKPNGKKVEQEQEAYSPQD